MFIVLATVRAKCFGEPVVLPPRPPTHVFTECIIVIDDKCGDAVSLVEPGGSLHHLNLFTYLLKHIFHTWELKLLIYQLSEPFATQFCCVKVRYTLNVTNEGHVWNQRMDCAPAPNRITMNILIILVLIIRLKP